MFAQIFVNSIISGSIYALNAFGFTLIYGTMQFFNMAYGINVMLGAYLFYILWSICHVNFALSIVLTLIGVAALMVGVDRATYFQLRKRNVPSWVILITSVAVQVTFEACTSMVFGNEMHLVIKDIPKSYSVLGASITVIQISILLVSILVMASMSIFLKRAKIGKVIRAIANDKNMALVIGVDVERVYVLVIILGSLLASIAGILISFETNIYPFMCHPASLKAITASMIGGVGSIPGAMIAGFLLGIAENFGAWVVGSNWKDAISLVIIVLMILIRPSFFGIEENR